jgi:hypothetical protein
MGSCGRGHAEGRVVHEASLLQFLIVSKQLSPDPVEHAKLPLVTNSAAKAGAAQRKRAMGGFRAPNRRGIVGEFTLQFCKQGFLSANFDGAPFNLEASHLRNVINNLSYVMRGVQLPPSTCAPVRSSSARSGAGNISVCFREFDSRKVITINYFCVDWMHAISAGATALNTPVLIGCVPEMRDRPAPAFCEIYL